jgi:hypothetical protein
MRLLRFLLDAVATKPPPMSTRSAPPLRVVPPVWASDDDIMLLRKAGLL